MKTRHAATPTLTIRKIARIEDKATRKFVDEIEFASSATEKRRLEVLPSVINDPSSLQQLLWDHGAILPDDNEARKELLTELSKSVAPANYVYEAQGGWLDPRKIFVLPDGAIAAETTNIMGISRSCVGDGQTGRRAKSGTWFSSRDNVGQLSRLSSLLMLTSSAAFAAPLLAITGAQSFGLCIYGKTRSGKTVATVVGASVIGIKAEASLPSWNVTDAHLEERLAEFNDLLFPIDDFSSMKGNDKEKYLRIRGLAYTVSQGWSKGRHSSWKNEGAQVGWRTILLTSSEKSIRNLAKEARVERQYGEALRLIDIPAVFDGCDHIFDRLPPDAPVQDLKKWKKELFASIAAECGANHGAALERYIERIITAEFAVKEYVNTAIAFFVQQVCEEADGDIARDVAGKFGLIYAGGMLAGRFGIVLWPQDELFDAIAKCFRAARDLLPDEGVALRQGIDILRACLRRLVRVKKLSKQELAATDWEKTDGYRWRPPGQDRYIIKCDAFNALFATSSQRDIVLNWLTEAHQITAAVADAGESPHERTAKRQFFWPDGKRRRSYEIVFPRG
jgi:hypothetical protein